MHRCPIALPVVLTSTLFLSACVFYAHIQTQPAYSLVKPGSTFKLLQAVDIPPGKASVHIQHGKIVNDKNIDSWRPSCRIIVTGISDNTRTIQPDEFKVLQTSYATEIVMSEWIYLAGLSASSLSLSGGDASITAEIYITDFFINSDTQGFVTRLSCQYWEDPHDGTHLNIDQIKATIQNVFELQ